MSNTIMTSKLQQEKSDTWHKEVRASFKKVVAFDLLFYVLGALFGAGIMGAILIR